jgi:hypothetical protein
MCPVARALSMGPTKDALLGIVWDTQFVAATARRGLMVPLTDFTVGFNRLEKKVTRVLAFLPRG